MKWAAGIFFALTAAAIGLYLFCWEWMLPFAITFGTFFYHFAMRLLVGHAVNFAVNNKADYTKGWYQLRPFEVRLYKKMKVKQWKRHLPTYDPALFDPKLHSWEEIAGAMCQAEIVHEVIVILSFLPLLAAIPFGSFWVFLFTSVFSALFDLCFVVIQRYNRPRIIKFLNAAHAHTSERRKQDAYLES